MQISKISSFNFMGANNVKKAASVAKKVEKEATVNPMKQFLEETPNVHEFYSPRNVIAKEKAVDPAASFYPTRNVISRTKENDGTKLSMNEVNDLVAAKRKEIKK